MKLSRLTLILGLAAALGLALPAKQVFCKSSEQSQSQSAESSGSPSYQAAQSYDSFDCFYAGCHADYGDILPELNAGETNANEETLPTTPSSEDADLPGDDPTTRDIPASVTSTPSPLPSYGFAHPEDASSASPSRGYFAPGYPHPGYQHPGYGYSHAMDTSRNFLNVDQSIQTEEELDIADLQEEPVPPEPEELVEVTEEEVSAAETHVSESSPDGDDYHYGYGYGESYEYDYESEYGEYVAEESAAAASDEAVDVADSEEVSTDESFTSESSPYGDDYDYGYGYGDSYDYDYESEYGEYVAEETAAPTEEEVADSEEAVAEADSSIQDEYTHYDDIYGFGSEWYGPYDATKVDTDEAIESDAEAVTDATEEAILEAETTASVQAVDPPIDEWLAESAVKDAGPAELEVDAEDAADFSEEDAASLNAAVKEAVDDWFYRETYGYGPRYDYDCFGYEDFLAESSPAQTTSTRGPLAPKVDSDDAESSFPWDYVYRLELGEIAEDSDEAQAVKIPFAATKSESQTATANADTVADQATAATVDPALPVSVDFDPAALISTTQGLAKSLSKKPLLEEVQGLWTALTPMELARTALAAAPDRPRQSRSVLVNPKTPEKQVEATKQSLQPAVALRDLAMLLDDAGQALLMLSHRVEALANTTSPQEPLVPSAPLQSRVPADEELETR